MDADKLAPVQGYAAGIPWAMHLRAYDAYRKMYGEQQALIEGHCRGGFGDNELDIFIPGWREELSELHQLRKDNARLQKLVDENLVKTADGAFVAECDKLYCPKCSREVRLAYDLCYCDECGNPDDGQWPPQPPLPLLYESAMAKPR